MAKTKVHGFPSDLPQAQLVADPRGPEFRIVKVMHGELVTGFRVQRNRYHYHGSEDYRTVGRTFYSLEEAEKHRDYVIAYRNAPSRRPTFEVVG